MVDSAAVAPGTKVTALASQPRAAAVRISREHQASQASADSVPQESPGQSPCTAGFRALQATQAP